MSGGDFFSRWSKRKRAIVREIPPESVPIAGEAALPPEEGTEGEALSPEELAELPSLDSLTAESDLAQFLRAGVPMVMRKAALRRMWSLDTNIRDYVSEAREYAYDWNAVGGVPGNGPLLPTDDIKAMLRDIFDGTPVAEQEQAPVDEQAPEPVTVASGADEPAATVAEGEAEAEDDRVPQVALDAHPLTALQPGTNPQLSEPRRASAEMMSPRPRRHGGAIPL